MFGLDVSAADVTTTLTGFFEVEGVKAVIVLVISLGLVPLIAKAIYSAVGRH